MKPHPHPFAEIHLKGLTIGDLPFIQQVKHKISPGCGIAVNILKNTLHILQKADMVHRVTGAGHQVVALLRAKGDHICHRIGNIRAALPRDADHALRKIHAGSLYAGIAELFAQNARTAGQVHRLLGTKPLPLQPNKQLLAENLRVVIPPKHIINLAKDLAVHHSTSV